jgi:hypothetical protein
MRMDADRRMDGGCAPVRRCLELGLLLLQILVMGDTTSAAATRWLDDNDAAAAAAATTGVQGDELLGREPRRLLVLSGVVLGVASANAVGPDDDDDGVAVDMLFLLLEAPSRLFLEDIGTTAALLDPGPPIPLLLAGSGDIVDVTAAAIVVVLVLFRLDMLRRDWEDDDDFRTTLLGVVVCTAVV